MSRLATHLMIAPLLVAATAGDAHAASSLAPGSFPPPAVRLTADAAASERPRVAIDPEGDAIVVWQDGRYGNREILWQKVDLMGVPLSNVERLTQTSASSVRPDVSCDARGWSHVVWQEGEANGVGTVYLGRRDAVGLMSKADVVGTSLSGDAGVAALADGQADVVWYRYTASDQDVYYRRYQLDGSYGCQRRFNAGTIPGLEKDPSVAVSGTGTATLLWLDLGVFFDYQLRQASVDNLCAGASSVSASPGNDHPRAAIDIAGSRIERLFELGGQIRRLTPANGTCQISALPAGACCVAIGTTADTSYAVWQDTRNGNNDIYFCQYVDCAKITPDLPLILSSGSSESPDIAVNHASGEWVAVWQENLSGNTEIFMTSSRLVSRPQGFIISGAVFDKQLYFNGSDVAHISVSTQGFAGASTTLRLHAAIETNLQDHYDVGDDNFTLDPQSSRTSSFSWPVPSRDRAWDFTLRLALYQGTNVVASVDIPKGAMGTNMTQAEIDQIVAQNTSDECDPPVTDCSMYLIGLVPGFGLASDLVGFQSDVCEMGRQWRLGSYWKATVSGFHAVVPAVSMALEAIPGASAVVKLLFEHAGGVIDCARELSHPASGVALAQAAPSVDSLAAYAATAFQAGQAFSNEIFLQGNASLRIGVGGRWTTADSAAIIRAFVFPDFGTDLRWGHVGLTPIPVGTSQTNPHSGVDVELRAVAEGPVEFGILHRSDSGSVRWLRYGTMALGPGSTARASVSDTSTNIPVYVDVDGDGSTDQIYFEDGTVLSAPPAGGEHPQLRLLACRPNPVREATTIRFELPESGAVHLGIYDAAGRRVADVASDILDAGIHSIRWGRAATALPSGLYFLRLTTPWGSKTRTVTLL